MEKRNKQQRPQRTRKSGHSGETLQGLYNGHGRGFGFFVPEHGGDDLFVPPGREGDAIDGDTVAVQRAGGDTVRVVKLLKRGRPLLVGVCLGQGIFLPDAHHIGKRLKITGKSRKGDKLLVRSSLEGFSVTKVLGRAGAPEVEEAAVLFELELEPEFPEAVSHEAQALSAPQKAECQGRLDLRHTLTVVTIDPSTSRDFDDAISLEQHGDEWLLGVHIADVSHYVRPGSAIDSEALRRGTSVYLPGRVLPMLPERLSNDLCSLREGHDRFAVSVLMRYSKTGRLLETKFAETVIRPARRFSYERASRVMDRSRRESDAVGSVLMNMLTLAKLLRRQRKSLELTRNETEMVFDATGNVIDLRCTANDAAHGVIEEFMLAANRQIARLFLARGLTGLYRHHAGPDDLTHVWDTLKLLGLEDPAALGLSKAVGRAVEMGYGPTVAAAVFRCMSRACYTSAAADHFSLGFAAYSHFTSPIRRYADLLVHRKLKDLLRQEGNGLRFAESADRQQIPRKDTELEMIAEHLNTRAAAAERAESRVRRRRILEFLLRQGAIPALGQITSVVEKGLILDLPEYGVSGFLALEALPGSGYRFEPGKLVNDRQTWLLGQDLEVCIYRIDPGSSMLDLSIAPES